MLIPLGTDRPIRRPSVVTPTLIVLCVAAAVAVSRLGGRQLDKSAARPETVDDLDDEAERSYVEYEERSSNEM